VRKAFREGAGINAVNLAEVVGKLKAKGKDSDRILRRLLAMGLVVLTPAARQGSSSSAASCSKAPAPVRRGGGRRPPRLPPAPASPRVEPPGQAVGLASKAWMKFGGWHTRMT
jgi:hypothetical protein